METFTPPPTPCLKINTTFPKRDTTLEKRLDIQGNLCSTFCYFNTDKDKPDSDDWQNLYNRLQSMTGVFTVDPGTSPSLPQDYDTKLTDARDRQKRGSTKWILHSLVYQPLA